MSPSLVRHLVASTLLLAIPSNGSGDDTSETVPIIPDRHWNENTRLWLARAFVSEAGWDAHRDHVGIAYVLNKRWNRGRKRYKRYRFVALIRQYCAGFAKDQTIMTARQTWVRELTLDAKRPAHWPEEVSWPNYKKQWKAALKRAEDWRLGKFADPCDGKSLHWGGVIDKPRSYWKKLDCGDTENSFYSH